MTLTDNFPVVRLEESDQRPEMFPMGWGIGFAGGHQAQLTRLHQYRTYEGKLCGLPNDPDRYVERAIAEAREWDKEFHGAPVLIHATITKGVVGVPTDPQYASFGRRSWAMLPAVTTFAEFRSLKPARAHYEVYSSMLMIWWQPVFGIPTDKELLNGIGHVDWVQAARDWSP